LLPITDDYDGRLSYETDGEVYFFDITASTWQKSVSPNAPPEVRMPLSICSLFSGSSLHDDYHLQVVKEYWNCDIILATGNG
jgi:hypothetical protein